MQRNYDIKESVEGEAFPIVLVSKFVVCERRVCGMETKVKHRFVNQRFFFCSVLLAWMEAKRKKIIQKPFIISPFKKEESTKKNSTKMIIPFIKKGRKVLGR